MKAGLLAGIGLGVMVIAAAPVRAEDVVFKPYVSIFAGAGFLVDMNAVTRFGPSSHYTFAGKTGYLIGGALGTKINDSVRVEVELSRAAWASQDNITFTDSFGVVTPIAVSGSYNATMLLANAWFDVKNDSAFTPYVGGGIGAGWANGDVALASNPLFGIGNGNKTGLAYQLGVGVKYDLSDNLAIDIGYRYKNILGFGFSNRRPGGLSYDNVDLHSHNVEIGLTYNF